MAEKDFVVKNGLVVNSAITINSTAIYYNGSQFINSSSFSGSSNNSTNFNGQPASFYTNATNISTGTLASARISGNYTGITNVGTLGFLAVSGNVNFDSGLFFVDSNTNRIGISNTTPDAELTVTGSANVSQDIRIGRDLYVARDFIVSGNLTTTGTSVANGDFNPASNGYNLGNTTSLWNLFGINATLTQNLSSNSVLIGTINATSNGVMLTRTNFTVGNSSVNSVINSTAFTGTSNNTNFVGSVSAVNVVSNAQLSANLANYQTTAGLSANVATLTANNTSFVGTVSAANVVSNAQLSANLSNYQTTAGLSANVARLTANNTSFVGAVSAANVVSNAQLSANLANYQTTAGLSANVATLTANNSTNFNGQPASFYTNATNISTGTLASARISGNYTGINAVGTLTGLTVNGNVSFTGNVNIDSGVLFVDGTNNRVGVNTTSPSVSLQIAANDAIFVPVGNTAQRPGGANGMFRFNVDTSTFEGYSNGSWGTIAGSGAGGYYKGNDGPVGNTNNKANLYRINSNTQSNNITIAAGENALTAGPMTIQSGFSLTIEEGGRAVII